MTEQEMISELYSAYQAHHDTLLMVSGTILVTFIYMAIYWFIEWLKKEPLDDYELKKIQKYL